MARPTRRLPKRYLRTEYARRGAVSYPMTQLGPALAQLDAGERPPDALVRGALGELRRFRRHLHSLGCDRFPENAFVFDYIADHIDVLRWVLALPAESELHLCVECDRRPRHFGDLCKRCAGDQRPRGKVGE